MPKYLRNLSLTYMFQYFKKWYMILAWHIIFNRGILFVTQKSFSLVILYGVSLFYFLCFTRFKKKIIINNINNHFN